ncbi:MAG: ATP-binding cassette domain-containing protein, partial [Lachnospiraceae bacterium]|nr:ATP-binding cassette domain-containing protein [Lachnospiraceae bacterium]
MISFENVSKVYEDSEDGQMALKDISLEIGDGEFVFVVGDSGSGKSTFLRLLLRELRPSSGVIRVGDQDLSEITENRELAYYRRELGVVFQDFRLLHDRTVYENVALAQHVIGKSGEEVRTNVTEVLTLVGLSGKYKSYPKHLSGGEQQRVAIARALVNHPRILLADEPTGNLDPVISMEIMRVLDEACRVRHTTTVVVTHDLEVVRQMKKRVITLRRGILIGDEPAPEVPAEELQTEEAQAETVTVSDETEPNAEETETVQTEPDAEETETVQTEPDVQVEELQAEETTDEVIPVSDEMEAIQGEVETAT